MNIFFIFHYIIYLYLNIFLLQVHGAFTYIFKHRSGYYTLGLAYCDEYGFDKHFYEIKYNQLLKKLQDQLGESTKIKKMTAKNIITPK